MSWFAELAGKAEHLLNNLDEQTGAVLRNHGNAKPNNGLSYQSSITIPQKKRQPPRNTQSPFDTRSSTPIRKSSPPSKRSPSPKRGVTDKKNIMKTNQEQNNRSPNRKTTKYNLNNSPPTLVNECNDGLRHRRLSLPTDLELMNQESLTYNMQNLEVENAMLKNEQNVLNREISELLSRLRKTEDEKDGLILQLNELKAEIEGGDMFELSKHKEEKSRLENEIKMCKDVNTELENKVKILSEDLNEKSAKQMKLEKDLKHTQSRITELESELEKSKSECGRLEKEWESYKHRVKNMLNAKDGEIKALRDGVNLSEDTKELIVQIDKIKEERDSLSEAITSIRKECTEMNQHMRHLETRHSAAERMAIALRDALKEERSARNKAEAQANAIGKDLQAMHVEMSQTIANLRTALQHKEQEIMNMMEASAPTSDSSALNVGDYDFMHSIDNDKINYLTQMLVQKQGKIDTLLADNNTLRIQMEKLETKFKAEVASARAQHSIIRLQEETRRSRQASPLSKLSLRIGLIMKRFPLLRIFIIFYMIGLHFWVMTVLFTSTPENYVVSKS
ncbi:golgin-84 isoform X2 [Leptidea sinapis]|uniref:golgin-84 isoform X2 n=1 Tax=Leptidea sinapis TaxID=189913 RepID=UPI0021C2FBC6|nr:golgin-84 isoform X2 [Leptidea sinapis]